MSDKQLNFENANVTITIDLEKSNTVSDIEEKEDKNKRSAKTTTIRCSQDNSNYINALTTVMDVKSVDEMLSILIDNYIPTLTHNEQTEIKTIKKVYDKKK
ncbi:hypothetical protein [Enterococcus faecalis]|uniref:hypothetical protein n=1 Tax=Enterococcus faecalis TaxID=1351 RepID=UPI002935A4B5|nr:hypothetical protein [Enterococcus faecalis]MDV2540883.1 hypothetical protein [Enterococcus faecalis]MDV2553931.1 hypothetical protein [Enterococcus faecalis]